MQQKTAQEQFLKLIERFGKTATSTLEDKNSLNTIESNGLTLEEPKFV